MPLIEKITEITDTSTCNSLKMNNIIQAVPVNFVRGLTFNDSLVIVDEAQNNDLDELKVILTRFGRNTKYVICGDKNQSNIKNSGFTHVVDSFNDEESIRNNIHCFEFGESEIVRSKILKFIARKLKCNQ
jgi:phosphate starvation-inducible PhoH-like protein